MWAALPMWVWAALPMWVWAALHMLIWAILPLWIWAALPMWIWASPPVWVWAVWVWTVSYLCELLFLCWRAALPMCVSCSSYVDVNCCSYVGLRCSSYPWVSSSVSCSVGWCRPVITFLYFCLTLQPPTGMSSSIKAEMLDRAKVGASLDNEVWVRHTSLCLDIKGTLLRVTAFIEMNCDFCN